MENKIDPEESRERCRKDWQVTKDQFLIDKKGVCGKSSKTVMHFRLPCVITIEISNST